MNKMIMNMMIMIFLIISTLTNQIFADISASRTIQKLVGAEVKIDIDGCTATDKYGCRSYTTDFGKRISGKVHMKGSIDLQRGSTFTLQSHIKTGIVPIPFVFTCPVCHGKCTIKIPIVNQEYTFQLPPCPLKLKNREFNRAFNQTIPRPPSPYDEMHGGFAGTVTVMDPNQQVLSRISFDVTETRPNDLLGDNNNEEEDTESEIM